MAKSTVRTYIKNTADPTFSKYIRAKEADRHGYCTCVTCGKRFHWKELDAGHYANRDHKATRYEEKNVHPQCECCNRFHSGEIARYAAYLVKRYGDGIVEELDQQSREYKKFTLSELKAMVKEWRTEIEKMRITKNL
jgi:hypothetical protein